MEKKVKIIGIVFFGFIIILNILLFFNNIITKTELRDILSADNQEYLKNVINEMDISLDNISYFIENKVYIYKGKYKNNDVIITFVENFTNSIEIYYNNNIKNEIIRIILSGRIKYIAKNYIWTEINNNSVSFQFKETSVYIIVDYQFNINNLIIN